MGGVALTGALAAGGLTIAAVNPLGIAGAQDNPATTVAPAGNGHPMRKHASKVLDDSLAALVKDGTLTQAQADAVKAKVTATAETLREERQDNRRERRQEMETTAAAALGVSSADLRAELKAGKTIAQVAQEKGVPVQTVIDAMVAAANKDIDQAVTDGKLDAAQAATRKQQVAERITHVVNDGPGGRR